MDKAVHLLGVQNTKAGALSSLQVSKFQVPVQENGARTNSCASSTVTREASLSNRISL